MGVRLLFHQHLRSLLENEGIQPTNNAAERALRQSVIQRKISYGVQSASDAACRSRLITVTTTLRQQGRDVCSYWGRPESPITVAWRPDT